jgi:hypothetical protein
VRKAAVQEKLAEVKEKAAGEAAAKPVPGYFRK